MPEAKSTQQLSEADFNRLRGIVKQAIKDDVPPIVRGELVSIGLAVDHGEGRVSAQRDMAFLRNMRQTAERGARAILAVIVLGIAGILGALLTAGYWALGR